mgnify:CR=1 FL=1|jgi:hypothetical protein
MGEIREGYGRDQGRDEISKMLLFKEVFEALTGGMRYFRKKDAIIHDPKPL